MNLEIPKFQTLTHTIHGTGTFTYILVDFYGTKVNIPYMDPMGNTNPFLVQPGWFLGVYVGTQKNHLRYLRLLKLLFV